MDRLARSKRIAGIVWINEKNNHYRNLIGLDLAWILKSVAKMDSTDSRWKAIFERKRGKVEAVSIYMWPVFSLSTLKHAAPARPCARRLFNEPHAWF